MSIINNYSLFFCFLLLASLIIFLSRQKQKKGWKTYLIANGIVLLISASLFYVRSDNIVLTILVNWLPLFLIFFFYHNAGFLSRAFHANPFDDAIIRFEKKLFRYYYPCIQLSETFNSYWLSEFLHLCYCSYFLLLFGVPLYFYLQHSHVAFYQFEFALLFVVLSAFLTHGIVPALSPRTIFEKIRQPLCDGRIYRMTHLAVEKGSTDGTAFPSVHVAVATLILLVGWHEHTAFFYCVMPIALGLIVSTIYGRFHYVIDVLFGILYASVVFMIVYG